jgi:aminobenzoyl-glutamate utilization protein A
MNVIEMRREFHQHAEVGFTEFWTAGKVVTILKSLGYEVIYGRDALDPESRRGLPTDTVLDGAYQRAIENGADEKVLESMKGGLTAVIGLLRGKKDGPTIGFRFDMDALPIVESAENDHLPQANGFRSKFEGNMHACAHDAHTAIGLGFAQKMANGDFEGTLMLIFQPAEEGGRGAFSIVKKGIVDQVNKIYCLHLGLDVPLGTIYGGSFDWLATSKFSAKFYGVPSHAGFTPEKGRNALLGAATATLNIHSIPRFSTSTTRVNVGILQSGTASNIIPQFANMIIETRSTSQEDNQELAKRVKNIIEHSAMMHDLQYEIELIGEAGTLVCDEDLVNAVLEEAKHVEGFNQLKHSVKGGASEDASFLVGRVQECGGQGTYMVIGTTIAAPHHHHKFDIDEKVLPMSIELLERIASRDLKAGK